MLPLSGRLEAASKSNSSTLLPSRTTTRVSSGWLESISIRLDMKYSGARANTARTPGNVNCLGPCAVRAARFGGGKGWIGAARARVHLAGAERLAIENTKHV